jgi:predicted  nucleic acid-binding Zn-ribbon protein
MSAASPHACRHFRTSAVARTLAISGKINFSLADGAQDQDGSMATTNPSIDALLDLQVIDKQRQMLKQSRLQRHNKLVEAQNACRQAEEAAVNADDQVEKMGALITQYTADSERCDATIADLRAKQMNAKTNKEYMAIINGIETARVEKNHREQSLKEINERVQAIKDKAAKAHADAAALKAKLAEVEKGTADSGKPDEKEQELERIYNDRKSMVDPKFLEAYERLVQAKHAMPLMKVDANTRSTPYGVRISMNQIEQIRMGKLVICSGTNSILYI